MQSETHYHSLSNNQNYKCREYDRFDKIVNDDPSPVKYKNMFLFDIPYGSYIEVVAYQRDLSAPQAVGRLGHFTGYLDETFQINKSNLIEGNVARIYKNNYYNEVIFSRHNKIPCIFCVPNANFKHPDLVRGKRPAQSGYSTMTLAEDENQKELYHKKKMCEMHEVLKKYWVEDKIPHDAWRLIQALVLPYTYD